MAEGFIALDDFLAALAERVDQGFLSTLNLKRLFHLLLGLLAIPGVLTERKNRTRLSLQALKNIILASSIDASFVVLGAVLDYLAGRVGKKKLVFTMCSLFYLSLLVIDYEFYLDG
jgi:hypothetical protein